MTSYFNRYFLNKLLVIIVLFVQSKKTSAQAYTFSPDRTYVTTVDTSQNNFGGIEILNTSTQNLNLTWRWVSTDTLIDSKFELCNSGICFMNLPASGVMPTIAPGSIGWIKFHMFSGKATGVNVIKYLLKHGSAQVDTLTFIINVATTTGIKNLEGFNNAVTIFPNPSSHETTLTFNNNNQCQDATIVIVNNLGQTVHHLNTNIVSGKNTFSIDTEAFFDGLYNVFVVTKQHSFNKKISVIH